jgi:release factor glutamine methyltransferase
VTAVGTRLTVRARLGQAAARLAAAGVATPGVDAEWLLAEVLGLRRGELWLALDRELEAAADERFERALARRERREPLQQVLGWEEFRGLRLRLTPDVLVPRPETEALVEMALALLPPPGPRPPVVVDVGCGSGCIACAIAHERPDARVLATDRSMAALAVARANVRALGLHARVALAAADLLTALGPGRADLVVCNPPYLPSALLPTLMPEVSRHEPRLALDGGADGLASLRRLIGDAGTVLRPDGALAVETAGAEQALEAARLLARAGFMDVVVRADLAGVDRLVGGRVPRVGGRCGCRRAC